MNKYVITLDPGTLGVPRFEYHFSMPSEAMALDYATRITRAYLVDIPWLAEAQLFDLEEGHPVAAFRPARHVAVTITKPDDMKPRQATS